MANIIPLIHFWNDLATSVVGDLLVLSDAHNLAQLTTPTAVPRDYTNNTLKYMCKAMNNYVDMNGVIDSVSQQRIARAHNNALRVTLMFTTIPYDLDFMSVKFT